MMEGNVVEFSQAVKMFANKSIGNSITLLKQMKRATALNKITATTGYSHSKFICLMPSYYCI